MMDRRRFVAAFAGGLVIARSLAEAQSAAKVYRIGFLLGATEGDRTYYSAVTAASRGRGDSMTNPAHDSRHAR